jgi:hypothetical protein
LQEVRPVLEDMPRPLDDMSDRLVALEHAVETLKEVRPELTDLHHQQLAHMRGDIDKLQEGFEGLKPEFCQGLDDVNLRVDGILKKNGDPCDVFTRSGSGRRATASAGTHPFASDDSGSSLFTTSTSIQQTPRTNLLSACS